MFPVYCFHSNNNFWKRIDIKKCNFELFCFLINCVLLRREHNKQIEIPYLLKVLLSIAPNKLPGLNSKAKPLFLNGLWCVTWYATLALLTLLLGSRVTYTRPTCVTLCPHSVFPDLG